MLLFAASVGGLILGAFFVLDMLAVTWAGMWFGLSSKKEKARQPPRPSLLVLVLPMCSLLLSCFGAPFFIGIPIFWIVLGMQSKALRPELRTLAAQRFNVSHSDSGLVADCWKPEGD